MPINNLFIKFSEILSESNSLIKLQREWDFNQHNQQRGFTLIEIVVVIAIVAIMAMWGMPSLQGLLASQRLNAASADYRTAFSVSRFESYGQGRRVVMAKSCALTPSGCDSSDNWNRGYSVFVCRAGSDITDECAAAIARGETRNGCVNVNIGSNECVTTPSSFYHAGATKQVFEGYSRRLVICDANTGGGTFRNSRALVFNPNGSIFYHDGTAAAPKSAGNLTFYIHENRGGPGADKTFRMSLTGDGQLLSTRDDRIDISAVGGGCETVNP